MIWQIRRYVEVSKIASLYIVPLRCQREEIWRGELLRASGSWDVRWASRSSSLTANHPPLNPVTKRSQIILDKVLSG